MFIRSILRANLDIQNDSGAERNNNQHSWRGWSKFCRKRKKPNISLIENVRTLIGPQHVFLGGRWHCCAMGQRRARRSSTKRGFTQTQRRHSRKFPPRRARSKSSGRNFKTRRVKDFWHVPWLKFPSPKINFNKFSNDVKLRPVYYLTGKKCQRKKSY